MILENYTFGIHDTRHCSGRSFNSDSCTRSSSLERSMYFWLQYGRRSSLDVESLFTNVPIASTINIILNAVYEHPTIPPPNIQKQVLEQLLHICTSETPFKHNGQVYKQINGVSMGSPLGPTFADFYMSYVENYLLSQSNRISNPCFYTRYVDDIMAVFNSPNHVHYFINRLRNSSILNFTVEYAKNGKFAFLDVLMNIDDGGNITTSVYCKPTDKGVYCNYFSHTSEMYKRSVIKTLVFKALKYTSNWPLFPAEIVRLKQLFCNNNYPQHLVESIIQSSVKIFLDPQLEKSSNDIKFFVQLTNLQTFNADSVSLKNIFKKHVTSLNPDKQKTS